MPEAEGLPAREPHGVFVGLATLDIIQRVQGMPGRNAKATALHQDVAGGGPALNAAVVFAALGGRSTLVTRIGTGSIASVIREEVESRGVVIIDVAEAGFRPSVSAIVVDDATGDRQIVSTDASSGGAGYDSGTAGPAVDVRDLVDPVDLFHFDGHHPDLSLYVARYAAGLGLPRVADAGRWKPVMHKLLPLMTDVICSADFQVPGREHDLLSWLVEQGAELAAVTDGPRPIRWRTRTEHGCVDAGRVKAVDTLGAGDFFHGAYSFARTAYDDGGRPLTSATRLSFASRIAALKCAMPGTRGWLNAVGRTSLTDYLRMEQP